MQPHASPCLIFALLCSCLVARAQFDYVDPVDEFRKKFEDRDPNIILTLNKYEIDGGDSVSRFQPETRAVALMLVRDFSSALRDVRNGIDGHYHNRPPHSTYPVNRNIIFRTYGFGYGIFPYHLDLITEKQQILSDIHQSSFADFEKDFLVIYFYSMILPWSFEDLPQLKQDIANYLTNYPQSPYAQYVDQVLNVQFEKGKFGYGFGAHFGLTVPLGTVNKTIGIMLPIGATYEGSYGRLVVKAIGTFTPRFRIKSPTTFGNVDYSRDSTFWTTSIHGALGYSVLDNKKYRFTPYVGAGKRDILLGHISHL